MVADDEKRSQMDVPKDGVSEGRRLKFATVAAVVGSSG